MTNLSQSDLDAIERIVEAKLKHYKLIQPIDTTEGEGSFDYCEKNSTGSRAFCETQCKFCKDCEIEHKKEVAQEQGKALIDTTEGEYVRCIEWNGELYTAGKIYHVVNGIIIDNRGFNDDYADLIKHQPFFEPATHAEFLAQEQGKAPIETEQRWIVEVQPFADHRDDVKIVVTLNDGFISKSSGRQLAEAIKKYLNIE
jgi:hypothetical protein